MAENYHDPGSGDDGRDGCTIERSDVGDTSLGVAVPAAIASRTDADVLDLEPLWSVADVDALDGIWGLTGSSLWDDSTCVSFPYMGHQVSVTPREVHLEPLADHDGDDESLTGG